MNSIFLILISDLCSYCSFGAENFGCLNDLLVDFCGQLVLAGGIIILTLGDGVKCVSNLDFVTSILTWLLLHWAAPF